MRGDDGTLSRYTVAFKEGWHPNLVWPPHPRFERSGSGMLGDVSGAWGTFVYLILSDAVAMDAPVWLAVAYDYGQAPP
jgi:hypothetical protein